MLPILLAAGAAFATESVVVATGAAIAGAALSNNSAKNAETSTVTRRITKDQIPESVRKAMQHHR